MIRVVVETDTVSEVVEVGESVVDGRDLRDVVAAPEAEELLSPAPSSELEGS